MADQPSAAQALYPNLASSGSPWSPKPSTEPAPSTDVYGSKPGIEVAREISLQGVAKPAGREATGGAAALPTGSAASGAGSASELPPAGPAPTSIDTTALNLPEGFVPDTALMEEFQKVPGLTQTSAQSLVELHQRAMTQASEKYWNDQAEAWSAASRADEEIGGRNLDAVVSLVQPLLEDEALTDPEFRQLLGAYGLGNHPAVIRTLFRWARAISQ